jgi:hypothetical protein
MSNAKRRLLKLQRALQPVDQPFSKYEDVITAIHEGKKIPWGTTPYLIRLAATLLRLEEEAKMRREANGNEETYAIKSKGEERK